MKKYYVICDEGVIGRFLEDEARSIMEERGGTITTSRNKATKELNRNKEYVLARIGSVLIEVKRLKKQLNRLNRSALKIK